MGKKALRLLFTMTIVWPVIWLWLGLRVRHRHLIPTAGPAIVVANHNSHMDVFALLSLFSLRTQQQVNERGKDEQRKNHRQRGKQ